MRIGVWEVIEAVWRTVDHGPKAIYYGNEERDDDEIADPFVQAGI